MEKNNGKIAIAIVAMFVVALSIVGFTYAYFTADVQGNSNPTSVEVQAGILEIVYANSNRITAQNLVPGWLNDGKHYYDPVASINEDEQVTAAVGTLDAEGNLTKAANGIIENPGEADGIATPATLEITNSTSTETAYYAIKLVDVVNGLDADDQENFIVTLYSTTASTVEGEEVIATTGGTPVWSGALVAGTETSKGEMLITSEALSIAKASVVDDETVPTKQYYYIGLEYKNIDDSQNNSMGKAVKATIDVVGLGKNNAGTYWVDEDGNNVFPITQAGS